MFSQNHMRDELLENNFWIDYFLQCDMYQKENWIDFESEISKVIQLLDEDMKGKEFDENIVVRELPLPFLSEKFLKECEDHPFKRGDDLQTVDCTIGG